MADIVSALLAIRPNASWCLNGVEYSGLDWVDTIQPKPTNQEINDEIARQEYQEAFNSCKAEAKRLLTETDWVELPSVSDPTSDLYVVNIDELLLYRKQLRVLAVNPVSNPSWPNKPDTKWNR